MAAHTTLGYLADIKDMPNQFEYSKEFFQRFYRPEYTTIIVVGDAATLKPQLQQLPWPLTELDAEGYAVPEAK